jgi:P27 family predicted phage terminase small subunit
MPPGRKRTPLKILQARGSKYANPNHVCADYRAGEPELKPGIPSCPSWLSKSAKAIWRQKTKKLSEAKILARIDRDELARYCDSYARYKSASINLQKGEYYKANDGTIKSHPASRIYNEMAQILSRLATEFGLTPVARTRVKVNKVRTKEDEAEEFLNNA